MGSVRAGGRGVKDFVGSVLLKGESALSGRVYLLHFANYKTPEGQTTSPGVAVFRLP